MSKRQARTAKSLRRREPTCSSYDRVLIVCEGEKTEPNYFRDIVEHYKLNTANVAIDGSCGSSPRSVFKRTIELWKRERQKGDPYDKVYCVFDKDSHETYHETIGNIANQAPKDTFFSAQSIPCFEYWLLLHFQYTTKPYAAKGNSSIADVVIKDLKNWIPEYEKGNKKLFSRLFDKLEVAKKNAAKSLQAAQENDTDNPSTHVHELVKELQCLKSKKRKRKIINM